MLSAKIHVIIVAAGSGSRFGGPLPKQFCDLAGRPVLMHTISAMRSALPSATISLVLSEAHIDFWHELCYRHMFKSPGIVKGGASRYGSVSNAIAAIPADSEIIMVHDGARPFPPVDSFEQYCTLLKDGYDGVVPAISVTDSLRKVRQDGSNISIDRSEYKAVQTPQVFKADKFISAYGCSAGMSPGLFTDDASVMTTVYPDCLIALGDGSYRNIKITNPGDLALAEFYLSEKS